MSIETNKALIRQGFEEGINLRKLEVFERILAPGYVNHSLPAPVPGPDGFRQVISMFLEAFPDMRITIEQVIAEGDTVVTRGSWQGSQRGAFMGVPPTGRSVQVNYIDIWRLEAGMAVENWVQMDLLGLMQQLGAVPTPAR